MKGYPMMLEVEPEEERVSSMDGEIMLYGVESLSSTKFSDCICVSVCVQLTLCLNFNLKRYGSNSVFARKYSRRR